MAQLTNPAAYETDPEEAWRRLKVRGKSPRYLAAVIALAAWREREAQSRDLPRQRVLRDEAVLDIAAQNPETVDALAQVRSMSRGHAEGRHGREILEALAMPASVRRSRCRACRRAKTRRRAWGRSLICSRCC